MKAPIVPLSLVLVVLVLLSPFFQSQGAETETPIKHVVIIILENHSFDSIYGYYPWGNPPIRNNITESLMIPVGYPNSSEIAGLAPQEATSPELVNPHEGYLNYHTDWDYGAMDHFLNGSGPQSFVYMSYQQAPLLWDYAEEYTLADNYFSPTLSVTAANRVSYLSGYPCPLASDGSINLQLPWNESIMAQLSENNISWMYYEYNYTAGQLPPFPVSYFKGPQDYSSHYANTSQFFSDLDGGKLPSVSFVMFTGLDGKDYHYKQGYDMHPPYNATESQVVLSEVVDAVERSQYWNSTVVFITFDEGGGYYDQVAPPIIPNYGMGSDPTLSRHNLSGYSTLGQRIPLIVISPFSKEGFIDNYTLSGYSILGFIDYNWRLPYLNQVVENSDVGGLLQAFNFSLHRQPLIITPTNWSYPLPLQYPIHYGYVATVRDNYMIGYPELYKEGLLQTSGWDNLMANNGNSSAMSPMSNSTSMSTTVSQTTSSQTYSSGQSSYQGSGITSTMLGLIPFVIMGVVILVGLIGRRIG